MSDWIRGNTHLRRIALTLLCVFASGAGGETNPASRPSYLDRTVPPELRARDLVSRMTLDEKASQMVNTAPAISRLDVPAYDFWSEGLHGVARSGYATMFPQAIGMAATWDEPLMHEVGTVISTEARAKYNDAVVHGIHSIYYGLTIWSPNINIFRDPRWGRGQETYGEDPFLTARMGTAFVRGIQGDDTRYFRAIATPKHFAVHSGPESDRHRFNISPSAHDLWDTYLPAFRATIVDGKADSLMCAYNAVDGKPTCASDLLLAQILRGDWKFKGFVTSDCGAIDDFIGSAGHRYSVDKETAAAAGVKAGTDTNCGTTYLALVNAVERGLISEHEVDVSLERLFEARIRLGLFDDPAAVPYARLTMKEVGSPANAALALRAANESIVLLKNVNGTLPLAATVKKIAVIGPNAASLSALEGNYNAISKNPMMPLDGIAAAFPAAEVVYAQGAPYVAGFALPLSRTEFRVAESSNVEGLRAEYFSNENFSGSPVVTRIDKQIDFDWEAASPVPAVPATAFSVRWTGTIVMPAAGDYQVSAKLTHCYPCRDFEQINIWLDERRVDSFTTNEEKEHRESNTPAVTIHFGDTKPHRFKVEYAHRAKLFGAGLTLEWMAPVTPLLDRAVEAAKAADVVVAFVGLSPELEGEEMPIHVPGFSGGDRTDIGLPAAQQQMLEAVKATGKPLIVVLMNGSALAVNWAQQHADAILEAWYPGEAGAQAIAETLTGRNNPSGRLPVTFYRGIDQIPPFDDYSMANRTYRYFTGASLYGFGYGLSYTSFAYSNLTLSSKHLNAGDPLTVHVDVKNTGTRAGDEVAELYLTPPHTEVYPRLALEGYQRVHLAPGQTMHLTFALGTRELSQVDARGVRAMMPGEYQVNIGGAQPAAGHSESAGFGVGGRMELSR